VATAFLSVARTGEVFAFQRVANVLGGLLGGMIARGSDTSTYRVLLLGSAGASSGPSAGEVLLGPRERCSKPAQRSALWGGTVVAMLAMRLLARPVLASTHAEPLALTTGTEYGDG